MTKSLPLGVAELTGRQACTLLYIPAFYLVPRCTQQAYNGEIEHRESAMCFIYNF